MTHGLTRAADPESTDDEHGEEDIAGASARFRIEIDAFGRLVPRVVPVDTDGKSGPTK